VAYGIHGIGVSRSSWFHQTGFPRFFPHFLPVQLQCFHVIYMTTGRNMENTPWHHCQNIWNHTIYVWIIFIKVAVVSCLGKLVFLITDLLLDCRPCHWWAKNQCFVDVKCPQYWGWPWQQGEQVSKTLILSLPLICLIAQEPCSKCVCCDSFKPYIALVGWLALFMIFSYTPFQIIFYQNINYSPFHWPFILFLVNWLVSVPAGTGIFLFVTMSRMALRST